MTTAAHTDLLTDTLYVAAGPGIVDFNGGAAATAVWKSKRLVIDGYPGFGWLRVNGPALTGVVVRVYMDGALFYTTPSITTRNPVRIPHGRGKRWEVEMETSDRITSLVLATTVEELA